MRRHQALDALAAVGIWCDRPAGEHILKNMHKLFGDLKIALITGMVKRDKNFIRQAPAVAGGVAGLFYVFYACFVSVTHGYHSISNFETLRKTNTLNLN